MATFGESFTVITDYCEKICMPFGICLNGIFNSERDENKDEKERDTLSAASNSNSLDRKFSTSSIDHLRSKTTDMGTMTQRGSLDRRSEKLRSWSLDDFANNIETFHPITITVSCFFEEVSTHLTRFLKSKKLIEILFILNEATSCSKENINIPIPGSI